MSRAANFLSYLSVLAAATAYSTDVEAGAAELLSSASRASVTVSPCPASADDLVGEVALRMWSRHRDLLARGGIGNYVETAVVNGRRDQLRKTARTKRFSDLEDDDAGVELDPVFVGPPDALALATTAEFRDGLASDDRAVLTELESGRNDREIAGVLERTRHSVRESIQRIRRRAQSYFKEDRTEPPTAPA